MRTEVHPGRPPPGSTPAGGQRCHPHPDVEPEGTWGARGSSGGEGELASASARPGRAGDPGRTVQRTGQRVSGMQICSVQRGMMRASVQRR